jgi:hypothetical protein
MEGTHALGGVVSELAGGQDEFVQLEVKIAEVRSHDVPVCLLSLELQLDEVCQDDLKVVCKLL